MGSAIDLEKIIIDKNALSLVPKEICEKYIIFPYDLRGNVLFIVAQKELSRNAFTELRFITKKTIHISYGYGKQIENYINTTYEELYRKETLKDMEIIEDIKEEVINEDNIEIPIITLVDSIIKDAVIKEASDIHIEAYKFKGLVRYRIDGVLKEVDIIPKGIYEKVCARIKIISGMNITIKFHPQNGKFSRLINNYDFDFRVSTLPTIYGEKIVIRILRKNLEVLNIDKLGFTSEICEMLKVLLEYKQGLVLITGPTGSGKSTTLYSFMKEIDKIQKNIISIEEPVEYEIEGVNQVNLSKSSPEEFSNILRGVLRQDPNVIMVGEVIDRNTAEFVISVAQTGHLVLTTLHTGDAAGAINRLIDMGIPYYLIKEVLTIVIAQRLCRKICENCKVEYAASEYDKKVLNRKDEFTLYKGIGCYKCNETGYKGRTISYEFIFLDEIIKGKIEEGTSRELKRIALENGMETVEENFKKLVYSGITTVEEYKNNIQIFNKKGVFYNDF